MTTPPNETAVGRPIDRVDGRLKVTGRARYAAEVPLEQLAHAAVVQSTIAKGRVRSIDTAAAGAAPGVLAILTHRNMPKLRPVEPDFAGGGRPGGGTVLGEDRLPLSDSRVHYAGQHLALVVAETPEQARHAASLVKVVYAAERPVLDAADPTAETEEPEAWFGEDLQHRRGDPDAAFDQARGAGVILEQTYTTPVEHHAPMEPSATTAVWEKGALTVYDSTQWVVGTQHGLARVFGLSPEKVRVVCPFVGGGFGCKGWVWPHTVLAAVAARVARRPVRLPLTRQQMFSSVGHRPATRQTIALAANTEGQLSGIRHATTSDSSPVGTHIETCGTKSSRELYDVANLELGQRLVRTNIATPTPMRAPGHTPGIFALECALDELAYALSLDPLELRLANRARVDPDSGRPWSSNHLEACYRLAAEKFGWQARRPEPRSMRDGRLLVGFGMATASYPGYRFAAAAGARILADGRAVVASAVHDLGTGAYTVFTQVAADELGLPVERVTFELGDSSLPPGPIAGGSNTTASVAPVVVEAVRAAKAKVIRMAVADWASPLYGLKEEAVVAAGGELRGAGDPSRTDTYAAVLTRAGKKGVEGKATSRGELPDEYSIRSFGAQFCEVKVDPDLGQVRVTRFVNAFDVGRVLNPKTARSQAIGGVVMGVGMALMEHAAYDPRTGRCVTDNLADYPVCVNADIGTVETYFVDEPDPYINPQGCRGIGEIAITGVAAAVANAVFHATGRRIRDLPIRPETLL